MSWRLEVVSGVAQAVAFIILQHHQKAPTHVTRAKSSSLRAHSQLPGLSIVGTGTLSASHARRRMQSRKRKQHSHATFVANRKHEDVIPSPCSRAASTLAGKCCAWIALDQGARTLIARSVHHVAYSTGKRKHLAIVLAKLHNSRRKNMFENGHVRPVAAA